jgi:hypothetical protein
VADNEGFRPSPLTTRLPGASTSPLLFRKDGDLGDGRERGGCARVGNDDVDAAEVVDRPRE